MALIGISGKIGSGKDTIGSIIQYLTSPEDSMVNNHNWTYDWWLNNRSIEHGFSKWKVKKFAGKLKEIVSILTGIPVEDLEKQEVKNTVLTPHRYTVRELMIKIGTDLFRDKIHQDIWVEALFVDYNSLYNAVENGGGESKWIITDMRFLNELKAVKDKGGISIRVNRDFQFNNYQNNYKHESETALDNAKFDYVIDNNSTIDDLIIKVKKILINEKII